jgi:nucleotide-binding universal stress UspA family protein
VTVHVSYYPEESIPRGTHIDPEREAERRRQEQAYLDETSARAAAAGIAVTAAVLPGSAVSPSVLADSILERADAGQVDLIVMATHARGAVGRLAAGGSVADELVRRANIPVLLVRPDQPAPATAPEPAFDPILIPLRVCSVSPIQPAFGVVGRSGRGPGTRPSSADGASAGSC